MTFKFLQQQSQCKISKNQLSVVRLIQFQNNPHKCMCTAFPALGVMSLLTVMIHQQRFILKISPCKTNVTPLVIKSTLPLLPTFTTHLKQRRTCQEDLPVCTLPLRVIQHVFVLAYKNSTTSLSHHAIFSWLNRSNRIYLQVKDSKF